MLVPRHENGSEASDTPALSREDRTFPPAICSLGLDEFEQIGIDLVGMNDRHSVWEAGVHL